MVIHRSESKDKRPPGSDGWLFNSEQEMAVSFTAAPSTDHDDWNYLESATLIPGRPVGRRHKRRMLRHNAEDAWKLMQQRGWEQCTPKW